MSHLAMSLLGSFYVTRDGEPVIGYESDTARALLVYLVLRADTPCPREVLAGLLWPEQPTSDALRNLRVALSRLRDATGDREADPPFLRITRKTLQFNAQSDHWLDVRTFRDAVAASKAHAHRQLERCAPCMAKLEEAASLYRDDFLAGFSLGSAPFEEWLVVERESLHLQALEALHHLARHHEGRGEYDRALRYAQRQVALEPWREGAHRQWMRCLALSGQRGAALAQYETCRQVLAEELGIEPEPETQALHDRIRVGALAPPCAPAEPQPQAELPAAIAPRTPVTPLPKAAPLPYPPDRAPAQPEGERRTVTVLSIGFVDPGAAAQDPEIWAEMVGQALRQATAAIARYGGEVSQLREDGLVALFGAGTAHEDDPERAILAALEIEQVTQGDGELRLQAGLHTGEAVVTRIGDGGRQAASQWLPLVAVLGNVVPVADQIQRAAGPDTVLVSKATYRLARRLFEWEAAGEIAADRTAVRVYRPLERAAQTDALRGKGRGVPGLESPLVGRDTEAAALQQALEDLQRGIGCIVTVVGEAGIGKSRLIAEIRAPVLSAAKASTNLQSPNLTWLEGRCLSYTTTEAYRLWMDVLRALLGVAPDATATTVRDTLRERVYTLCGGDAGDVYPFLARLMSLPLEQADQARLHGLDGKSLRDLTFRAWETLLQCATSQAAMTLVCEDLHWADPTSLALLEYLLPLAERVPLLVICVFRPITDHGCWQIRELAAREFRHLHTDLWLEALSEQECGELVGHLLHPLRELHEDLPRALHARILEHAEGNPFYVEEILRSLIDRGALVHDEMTGRWRAGAPDQDLVDLPLPDTLRGVLSARIDRLPLAARHVLQLASVVGRVFRRGVLESLVTNGSELDQHLRALQRAQMVRRRSEADQAVYIFKHQLTQEAAYASLLRRKRRALHRRVAEALERLYPEQVEEQLGLLAYHWERASDVEQAVRYLRSAGEQAAAHFANAEAAAYYTRALDLTPAESVEGRYALLLAREAVHNVQGAREAQDRDLAALEELLPLLGDRRRAEVAVRRAHHAIMIGDYARAIAAAHVATRFGQVAGDVSSQAAGHRQWGRALWRQGKDGEAQVQFERGLMLAQGARLRQEQAYCMRGLGLLCDARGDLAGARAHIEQALQAFRQIDDRRGEGMSLRDLAYVLMPQGEMTRALRCLEQSLRVCRETGDRRDEGWALYVLGHYHWFAGDYERAVGYYERSVPLMHDTADPTGEAQACVCVGLVHLRLGAYRRAQQATERAKRAGSEADPFNALLALAFQALASHYLGDDEKALEECRQVQHITQHRAQGLFHTWIYLGHTLSGLGRLAEAADAYAQASEMLPDGIRSADPHLADMAAELYAGQARVYLAQGELAPALVCVEKLLPRIEIRPTLFQAFDPHFVYLSCYRVLCAHADPRAGPLLRAAYELLQEQALKIEDPALQRSFLENVAAHREIIALWKEKSHP